MATINNIGENDNISDSRSVINTNFTNLNNDKIETSVLDTDTALAANSDAKVATQKAVKAYVDAGGNADREAALAGNEGTPSDTNRFVTEEGLNTADYQEFTASGTWTKPADYPADARVYVEMWGGGGGGGSNTNAGGGGGGGYTEKWFKLSQLGATETVTVGAGGAAASSGGNTTFGSLLTAYGGAAGGGAGNNNAASGGSGGGPLGIAKPASPITGVGNATTNGVDVLYGAAGGGVTSANGALSPGVAYYGGGGGGSKNGLGADTPGGTSVYAGAGGDGNDAGTGVAGTAPAGGGGGGSTGGAGARGEVRVTVFK